MQRGRRLVLVRVRVMLLGRLVVRVVALVLLLLVGLRMRVVHGIGAVVRVRL